jgi:hypothetical protein
MGIASGANAKRENKQAVNEKKERLESGQETKERSLVRGGGGLATPNRHSYSVKYTHEHFFIRLPKYQNHLTKPAYFCQAVRRKKRRFSGLF